MGRMMGEEQALALALEGRTNARGETADLVALAEGLAALPEPQIDATWAAALEARLLEDGLEEAPLGRPSLTVVTEPAKIEQGEPVRRAPVVTLPRRRLVVRRSVAAVAAAAALAAFPVAAAASSLPDSPFYGLKRFMERAEVAVFGGPVQDAFTHIKHANVRLQEAQQMSALGYADDKIGAVIEDAERLIAKADALIEVHTPDDATLGRLFDAARAIEQRATEMQPTSPTGALAPVIQSSQDFQNKLAGLLGQAALAQVTVPELDTTVSATTTSTLTTQGSTGTGGSGSQNSGESKTNDGSENGTTEAPKQDPGTGKGISGEDPPGCEIPGSANGLGDLMAPLVKVWCP